MVGRWSIALINAWEGRGMEGKRGRERREEGLSSSSSILVGAMTGQYWLNIDGEIEGCELSSYDSE